VGSSQNKQNAKYQSSNIKSNPKLKCQNVLDIELGHLLDPALAGDFEIWNSKKHFSNKSRSL
jgi:hypothetical protein